MDKQQLYDSIAERKSIPKHYEPYTGGNGRIDKCVKLVKSGVLGKGGTLLDVGGSIGDLGYALKDEFERRIILDISAKVLEAAAAKGNQTLCCDVDKNGFAHGVWWADGGLIAPGLPRDSVDLVTALDFIEHIVDPDGFARECFRVLKSGGHVFINTPNIQFWRHQFQLATIGLFPHTSGDQEVFHGGHLAFFTFLDLCTIFQTAGFKNCEFIQDSEGYVEPNKTYIDLYKFGHKVNSKEEYLEMYKRLGQPNILFKCVKP